MAERQNIDARLINTKPEMTTADQQLVYDIRRKLDLGLPLKCEQWRMLSEDAEIRYPVDHARWRESLIQGKCSNTCYVKHTEDENKNK